MRRLLFLCPVICALCRMAAAETATAGERCAGLAGTTLDHARVASAELVPVGGPVAGVRLSAGEQGGLPSFCRVRIADKPSPDSETLSEVWLPSSTWNGRYQGVGNGGFAGNVEYARMAASVAQGYAVSSTDAGHEGPDASFALGHPERVKDFGWRAVHDTAVQAKVLVKAFYGSAAAHAYFVACSDGGREALMEAQRFPEDYDGILAGAPAYKWTALVSSGAADEHALLATPESYIPARKLKVVGDAVRAACDAADGVRDGVVNDPRACGFDPATLACKAGDADDCLTMPQVESLKTIYARKRDAAGKVVFPGYSPGSEDARGGWAGWVVGAKPADQTALVFFSTGYFGNFVYGRKDWSLKEFDFARDYAAAVERTGRDLDAVDTNLMPFAARGGRLILYHGWSDPAIAPLGSAMYYDGVAAALGKAGVESAVRLYMVPGMLHCDGGPGANAFGQSGWMARGDARHDVLTALEQWVEAGKAPWALTATKFVGDDPAKGVEMTRPLCAYPAVAKFIGGDSKDAGSFVCAVAK